MDGIEQRGGRREFLSPWWAVVESLRLYRMFPNHPMFQCRHMYKDESVDLAIKVSTMSGAFMFTLLGIYWRLDGMARH